MKLTSPSQKPIPTYLLWETEEYFRNVLSSVGREKIPGKRDDSHLPTGLLSKVYRLHVHVAIQYTINEPKIF